ncbi:MAG: T9SS type A sorting domain-containing protein [Flavobacterium sp.]|nr:T9SS type A sorting domain-containing protein [Flavobacterium sp.]
MRKIKIIIVLLLFVFVTTNAQQTSLASGGSVTGSNGSVSFSIGQIDYVTAIGNGGTATQGVQQPFEIVTLSGEEYAQITLQMMIYPNPTISFVNLKIDDSDFQDLCYQLFDLNGREIANQKITTSETKIELENLSQAIYLLNVNDKNKTLKTFKIIKNN